MKKYLIDTNVLINELRGQIRIADKLPLEYCALSFVTIGEIWQGIKTKEEAKIAKKITEVFTIYWGTEKISKHALELMNSYTMSHGLYLNDALIAATAIITDSVLITENLKHFKAIDGLTAFKFSEVSGALPNTPSN